MSTKINISQKISNKTHMSIFGYRLAFCTLWKVHCLYCKHLENFFKNKPLFTEVPLSWNQIYEAFSRISNTRSAILGKNCGYRRVRSKFNERAISYEKKTVYWSCWTTDSYCRRFADPLWELLSLFYCLKRILVSPNIFKNCNWTSRSIYGHPEKPWNLGLCFLMET